MRECVPYLQWDWYSKTFGGDNEAGVADDGEFNKAALGIVYRPVTLGSKSGVAKKVNFEVHKKKSGPFRSYWQEMIFSGRATPPPARSSDSKVMDYIQANLAAIGCDRRLSRLQALLELQLCSRG